MNQNTPKKTILSIQPDMSRFMKLTDEEKKSSEKIPEASTYFKDAMKRFRKNPLGVGALIALIFILVLIVSSVFFCPYSYSEILTVNGQRDITAKNLAPFTYSEMEQELIASGGKRFPHIFGTDELCRDYFSRVMAGTRISLFVGIFSSLIVLVIGSVYGSISGLA